MGYQLVACSFFPHLFSYMVSCRLFHSNGKIVTADKENYQSNTLFSAVLATAVLDQACNLIRERWQEVTPEFVQALFQASHHANKHDNQERALYLLRLCWLIGRWQKNGRVIAAALQDAAAIVRDTEPTKAADLYRQALEQWQTLSGKWAQRKAADCHHELGNIHLAYLVDLPLAADYYRKALAIYESLDEPQDIADALGGLGNVLRYQGHLDDAIAYFQRAITLVRQLNTPGDLLSKLNNLGLCLHMTGDAAGAITCYREVLDLAGPDGDPQVIVSACGNLGGTLMNTGRLEEATAVIRQGLHQATTANLRREEAYLLSILGAVHLYVGDMETAVQTLHHSLTLFESVGDPLAATGVLTNLGLVAQARQQLEQALVYHQEALSRYRQKGEQQGQAQVLCNLGAIYDELGQKDEAQSCFECALAICRTIGYRQGQATALGGLGLCHLDGGRYAEARAAYEEAMEIDRAIGYRRGLAINHANLGLIAFQSRDLAAASDHYQDALAESQAIADGDGEANALQMLGRIMVEQGAYQEALRLYEQAAEVAQQHGLSDVESQLHNQTARALAALGQTEAAFAHLKQALTAQAQIRAGLTAESHRLSYLETRGGAYRNMVWLCLELVAEGKRCNGRSCLATALEYVEQSRSRTLVDALARQPLPVSETVPSDLLSREKTAMQAIQAAAVQLASGQDALATYQEIKQQNHLLSQVWAQIAAYAPEYVALRQGEAIDYQTLQQNLYH